jgi:hypothetical protein
VLATSPALAAGGAPARALLYVVSTAAASEAWRPEDASVAVARVSEQPLALQLAVAGPAGVPPKLELPPPASSSTSGTSSGYKNLLGSLVIARDLSIPGAESMGLRLIPTSDPLAGESATIVFRPRLIGSSWVGVDVAARF